MLGIIHVVSLLLENQLLKLALNHLRKQSVILPRTFFRFYLAA